MAPAPAGPAVPDAAQLPAFERCVRTGASGPLPPHPGLCLPGSLVPWATATPARRPPDHGVAQVSGTVATPPWPRAGPRPGAVPSRVPG